MPPEMLQIEHEDELRGSAEVDSDPAAGVNGNVDSHPATGNSGNVDSDPAAGNNGNVGSFGEAGGGRKEEEALEMSPSKGICSSPRAVKRQRSRSPKLPLNAIPNDQKTLLDEKCIREKSFRQSPRLVPTLSKCEKICRSTSAQKAYVEQMKFRRSPRLSTPIELSNSSVNRKSKVKTISRNSTPRTDDTKCSRCSSEEITPSTWVENDQTKSDYPARKKYKKSASSKDKTKHEKSICCFIGDPIPDDEAQRRWGWRYELKDKKCKGQVNKINEDEEDEIIVNVKCHYAQASIANCIFTLGDCAIIKGEGEQNNVGKIIEFFQTTDSQDYFRVQWFYRIKDTVVRDEGGFHDKRRLFYSSVMNDNPIDCIIEKASISYIKPRVGLKLTSVSPSDFYYDMEYCVDYSTFRNIPTDNAVKISELPHPALSESPSTEAPANTKSLPSPELHKTELALLDLYSGCGGMSTGLCLGAKISSVNLVARWAVDSGRSASKSLKLNHPDTHVRNESADDFLELLKEWDKLCKRYNVSGPERTIPLRSKSSGAKEQVNSQSQLRPKRSVVKEQLSSRAHDTSDDELEVSRCIGRVTVKVKIHGNQLKTYARVRKAYRIL